MSIETQPGSPSAVQMISPVFKLGALALKALCKPVGKRIKKEAGYNPKFRQSIINIAQVVPVPVNHRLTTTMQRHIYSRATNIAIRPLNEEKAVQAAADLLGELFIFTVAVAVVMFDVQRSSRSEARKEQLRKRELELMKQRHEELARELQQLKHRISKLEPNDNKRSLSGVFYLRSPKGTGNKAMQA